MNRLKTTLQDAGIDPADVEYVLVAARYLRNSGDDLRAHLPDPDNPDEPRCRDCSGQKRETTQNHGHFHALKNADESTPWAEISEQAREGAK